MGAGEPFVGPAVTESTTSSGLVEDLVVARNALER
jgi:hypothetical protein